MKKNLNTKICKWPNMEYISKYFIYFWFMILKEEVFQIFIKKKKN